MSDTLLVLSGYVERALHLQGMPTEAGRRPNQIAHKKMALGAAIGVHALARHASGRSASGFSMVEAIVAAGLLAGALAVLGQMFAIAMADTTSARTGTVVAVLADQKMEQLRGLTWGFDVFGAPITDTTSNIALPIQSATGGRGLSPSPSNSLRANLDGYVDYVDRFGVIIGGGSAVPDRAMYVRRWSIEPLPASPDNTLILRVMVTRVRSRGTPDSEPGFTRRRRDEAHLASVRTRKSP